MQVNSNRLEILIDQTGLTQADVARLIGRSKACISLVIKNGRASRQTVEDLCKVLRVTPDVLMPTPEDKTPEETTVTMAAIHRLNRRIDGLEETLQEILTKVTALEEAWK